MIHPGNDKPETPPENITIRPNAQGGQSVWRIDPQNDVEIMTIQNNVGIVKIFPGTQVGGTPRVRFELELWRLPAQVIQLDWDENAPPQGLGGPLKKLFTKLMAPWGGVDHILKIHSLNPPSLQTHYDLYKTLMRGRSELSRAQREMIAVVVSTVNQCHY
jgi:hypothetical protein